MVKPKTFADIILGYTQKETPPPPGTIGKGSTIEYIRTIGFYNSKGAITSIEFSEFVSTVKKINN